MSDGDVESGAGHKDGFLGDVDDGDKVNERRVRELPKVQAALDVLYLYIYFHTY